MLYYLIRQEISTNLKSSFKLYNPNIEDMKKIIETVDGNVQVFLVDESNNRNENLTDIYGKTGFNYHKAMEEDKLKGLSKITMKFWNRQYYLMGTRVSANEHAYFYSTKEPSQLPKEIIIKEEKHLIKIVTSSIGSRKSDEVSKFKGDEYERYIGMKYEEKGFVVEYRGLDMKRKDGGIDLVARAGDKTIFVQCKNWIEVDNYKISSRDIRAFIGDCYLLMLKMQDVENMAFHFIVSDGQMIDESTKLFIEESQIVKLKEVRFEGLES